MVAAYDGAVEIVKLLVDAGANISYVSPEGSTALANAGNRGHVIIGEVLIENGANINQRDSIRSTTPLIWVVIGKSYDFAKMLLENKADVNLVDMHRNLALWYVGIEKP